MEFGACPRTYTVSVDLPALRDQFVARRTAAGSYNIYIKLKLNYTTTLFVDDCNVVLFESMTSISLSQPSHPWLFVI